MHLDLGLCYAWSGKTRTTPVDTTAYMKSIRHLSTRNRGCATLIDAATAADVVVSQHVSQHVCEAARWAAQASERTQLYAPY